MIKGLDALNKKLSKLPEIEIDGKEILENVLEDWKKTEPKYIVNSAGDNINEPFRNKNLSKPWRKKRKFDTPFSMNVSGIDTGATYTALNKDKPAGVGSYKVTTKKNITNRKLVYKYMATKDGKDITKFINFNIGASKLFLEVETAKIIKILSKTIQGVIK